MNAPLTVNSRRFARLLTNPTEVLDMIKTFPNQKAPGPDQIQNIVLKNLSRKALVQFTYIINSMITLQYFPSAWKTALVVPIHKPGKNPKLPTSYRPISLLSTLSKVAEKVILSRLQTHIHKHNIIPHFQFGFRPRHNTTQQLARIVTDITTSFNKQKVTVMALLDVEKAFDKVWIEGLIYKMIQTNFPPLLIKLIHSYLINRRLRVKVNQVESTLHPIRAGVPQGSCLGPALFSLYLHDIPTFPQTKTALYADDTALFAASHSAEVANKQIQIHINTLLPYWALWKVSINHDKTETIVFARKHTNVKVYTPLTVHDHKSPPKPSVKYLGMTLESRLFHVGHIKNAIRKAAASVKSLYPLLSQTSRMSPHNKRLIYTTIIRPTMTYAAPIWCSAS